MKNKENIQALTQMEKAFQTVVRGCQEHRVVKEPEARPEAGKHARSWAGAAPARGLLWLPKPRGGTGREAEAYGGVRT